MSRNSTPLTWEELFIGVQVRYIKCHRMVSNGVITDVSRHPTSPSFNVRFTDGMTIRFCHPEYFSYQLDD